MSNLKGSETEKNLLKSFAGESQARNRYTFFASQAKKEGYVQIAQIFELTANQEKEHAKRFWSYLEGGEVEITACYPAGFSEGLVGTTAENLKHAAEGENCEWTDLYPHFAEVAKKEGFTEVAQTFTAISIAEKQHEKRYRDLLKNIEDGKVFKRDKAIVWNCINCGYIHESLEAPKSCPACKHPQSFYELLGENW